MMKYGGTISLTPAPPAYKYSDRIEELAVTKERTRIAQELHDSLGHYLAALKRPGEALKWILS
jgi:signal transduction histidine kinase